MEKRQIKGKYLIAGVLTLLIFLLGMLLGLVIEGKRVSFVQTKAEEQKLDFVSLQLQYQLISDLSKQGNCQAVSATFEQFLKELSSTEDRLVAYERDATVNRQDFRALKQEYIQAQVNYWMLAKKTKNICDRDLVTVLYFYSPSEFCEECDTQGFVLTYLKNIFKEKLLVFSFDSSFKEEQLIDFLINTYNITEYPSLVIEDTKVSGFHESESLMEHICPLYSDKPEACLE